MSEVEHSVRHYESGSIRSEEWRNQYGELHRIDDPAFIWYFKDGNVGCEDWYLEGKLHREDGPARIWHYSSGGVESEDWYQHGKLHRENGPAVVWYHPDGSIQDETWYQHGVEVCQKPEGKSEE